MNMETAILLIQCYDQQGIVAKVSDCIFKNGANIIQSDQHSTDPQGGHFFMRIEFCFDTDIINKDELKKQFGELAKTIDAKWQIHFTTSVMKMGVLVSKQDHCLYDLLYRWKSGDISVNIPFIISNHLKAKELADQFSVPFYHFPIDSSNKEEQEKKILNLVNNSTDFLVLARYMQILSEQFLTDYKKDVINIHHSFLPSFKGANPYKQAYERGVKVIGATAHFVTSDLDEGPIIEQVVEPVSHRDNEQSMRKKGKNLEKAALSNAVTHYLEHKIIRYQNRTVVF
ncbi:formyltetrahydrofolate deformylase [Chitinispirillales bacterium ANBcel5]|uniref:formyltetrahydrofolate deformylase n=1 Tax=Cellulosispirillum alkaliphilum TaxID=3039283 RepID=UPI002A50AF4A|nr:formyltetrahydrofolate deformylase [Chitinispirillales bacterium ANBcel5]